MSESESVAFSQTDGIATITLNRPEALNAMTDELMRGISEGINRVVADDSVRVVVLTGAGRGFCSGADLGQVGGVSEGADDVFVTALRDLMNCPVPTIARVNGAAAGGGFGLALACDITIAAESAFFIATFSPRLGIVPDLGSTWSIPLRVGRARALGIMLLGERISAAQAQDWGLIWRCVDDDQLDDEVVKIGAVLARSSPAAATRTRQSVDTAARNSFSDQMDLEIAHQAVLIPRNMLEGSEAFMEKREPNFGGERDPRIG
jgi:2-(1,2-epoxy-1,2-dihydrophenyl)acetyl-CoA isomerase